MPTPKTPAPDDLAEISSDEIKPDPEQSARDAGLRYVSDAAPGFTRRKSGRGFSYRDTNNHTIRDAKILARIKALAFPPAYREVWICPHANGHIQATGLDERGRKQYRYHTKWRAVRDESKYTRTMAFGRALPLIRERTASDLRKHGLPREKVIAAIVQLLEKTAIRIGNEAYVKTNKSFGLTTLRNRHVEVSGTTVHFDFKGKSSKEHHIDLKDAKLAKIVAQLQELPGQELFQYLDENEQRQSISSSDVNDYLHEITGQPFSAKDFRTWTGTILAALALREFEKFDSETQAKKNIVAAIESVAERLGNTPAVCRQCYVHPAILDSYLDGSMLDSLQQNAEREWQDALAKLSPEEAAVMALLQSKLAQQSAK